VKALTIATTMEPSSKKRRLAPKADELEGGEQVCLLIIVDTTIIPGHRLTMCYRVPKHLVLIFKVNLRPLKRLSLLKPAKIKPI
jgi:hypothetical protein